MIKKYKKSIIAALLALNMFSLSACGSETAELKKKEIEDNTKAGVIDYETSRLGIDSDSKKFEEELVSGTFYVVHDGIYYPAYTFLKNDAAEEEISDQGYRYVNNERMAFYTTENVIDIPTLFPGDHLVYYSTDTLLDYITWERYKDLGITFAVRNLQRTTAGKYYIDLTEDEEVIIPESELYEMYNLDVDNVMIDKVGGVVLDENVVQSGIIVGATKGKTYDMEVYTGTNYKHYNAIANIEAMQAYELFASIGIDTLQDYFWEIDIPDYFVNGYYDINGCGIVRILKDASYSEDTDYNEQLLFPDPDTIFGKEGDYVAPAMYSEYEELNYFSNTTHEGTLGYEDPNQEEETETEETKLPDAAKFKEANTMEYELWFPEDKLCSIRIKSRSEETTGQAIVEFDTGTESNLSYNRFDKVYELDINGKGNTGKLIINGFWFDYDIELTNVEIYKGQDAGTKIIDSDAEEPSKEETEISETESQMKSEE